MLLLVIFLLLNFIETVLAIATFSVTSYKHNINTAPANKLAPELLNASQIYFSINICNVLHGVF